MKNISFHVIDNLFLWSWHGVEPEPPRFFGRHHIWTKIYTTTLLRRAGAESQLRPKYRLSSATLLVIYILVNYYLKAKVQGYGYEGSNYYIYGAINPLNVKPFALLSHCTLLLFLIFIWVWNKCRRFCQLVEHMTQKDGICQVGNISIYEIFHNRNSDILNQKKINFFKWYQAKKY